MTTYQGDFIQTAVNGYDLSQQIERIHPCAHGYRPNGLIPDNVGIQQYTPGVFQPEYGLSGWTQRGQGSTGLTTAHNLFRVGSDAELIALSALGANTAPTAGDLCFAFDGTLMEYTRSSDTAAFQKWQASFKPGGVRLPPFPVLLVNASQAGSLTSAGVDDGAESTGTTYGAASILQVLTPTGTAATNLLGLSGLPADGNVYTLVIDSVPYAFTWKTSPAAAGHVQIGATVAACLSNLFQALVGSMAGYGTVYYAGTTPLDSSLITVSTPGASSILLTAAYTGTGPNTWTAAKSGAALTVGGATFGGGSDGETATIIVEHAASSGGPYSALAAHALDMTRRGAEIVTVPVGQAIGRYLRAVITLSGATQPWAARLALGRWYRDQV